MRKYISKISLFAVSLTVLLVIACGGDDEAAAPAAAAAAPAAKPAAAAPAAKPAAPAPAAKPAAKEEDHDHDHGDTPESALANGSFLYTGPMPTAFSEAPMLAAQVDAGKIPPVEKRLPKASDVMVVPVVDRIGEYGGTWRRAFTGPNDGQNADRIMMDAVLYYDLDGATVIPNVAKSYSLSADGLSYTLKLREGMKWSDGTEFTSENFVWHHKNIILNTEINPTRKGQIGWSGFSPASITAPDKYTVVITLPERGDGFLDKLASYFTGGWTLHARIADGLYGPTHYEKTIHRDFVADQAAYDKAVTDAGFDNWVAYYKRKASPLHTQESPVVSPWMMTKPITEELYEWVRNPYYWAVDPVGNQLPYIDKISMTLTSDQEVLNLKAASGEIDFQHRHILMDKVPVFKENSEKSNIETAFWAEHGAQGSLLFNVSYGEGDVAYEVDPEIKKWLQSSDFRTALSYGIDRDKVNEVMFLGTGTPKQPSFMKGHPFYPGDDYANKHTKYDVAEANKRLDALGLDKKDSDGMRLRSDGNGTLSLELMYIANYFVDYETLAELIAEDLTKIGIKTFMKAVDVSVIAERRDKNDIVLYATGSRGARDPLALQEWFSIGAAYRNWYTGGTDGYSGTGVAADPSTHPQGAAIKRLGELADEAKTLAYGDRKANYIETQQIVIDNMFIVGLVGDTPAFNGVVVKKKNFLNVPANAPNQSALQNPGIGRTVQFFFEGGKNDAGN